MVTFPPPTLLPSGCAPERPQKNLTLHTSITGNLPRESAYTGLSFLLLLPHSPERGFRRKNSYIIKLSVPFLKKKKLQHLKQEILPHIFKADGVGEGKPSKSLLHHSNSAFTKGTSTAHNAYKIIKEAHASRQDCIHLLCISETHTHTIIMLPAHKSH